MKKYFPLTLVLILAAIYMLLYYNMTKDDTFIFLQFVRNMLVNNEMSFNVGEPTYGFTSVLWTLILFCAGGISPYLLVNAKVLSFVCSLGAILSFYYLSQSYFLNKRWQLAVTGAFALNPVFIYISCSGMETSLAVLLAVSGVAVYLKERDKNKKFFWFPVIFALAYLTRPEMLLFIALAVVDIIVNGQQLSKIKTIAILVAEYVLVLLPWLLVAQYNFGTIIPNPVIIKAVHSLSDYSVSYIFTRLSLIFGSMHTAEFLIILLSGGFLLWRKKNYNMVNFLKENLLILGWIFGLLASYLVQKVSVSPRYLLIISPFIVLFTFILIERLFREINPKLVKLIFGVSVALFIGQTSIATSQIYYPHAKSYNAKDNALKEIALWLRDNSPEGSSVASIDIGILGYFSNRKVVDLTGLINPEKIKTPLTVDYLKEKNVDYFLDRHPIAYYLIRARINASKWDLTPLIFREVPSYGWHYKLVESQDIGFSLYQIDWKE